MQNVDGVLMVRVETIQSRNVIAVEMASRSFR